MAECITLANRASAVLYRFLRTQPALGSYLIPANVCSIVPKVFAECHQPFELVDISPFNFAMDPDQVLNRLKRRPSFYGGVLFVHPYGRQMQAGEFFAQLRQIKPDLKIVDDRCLCLPQFESTKLADLTLYSTGYAKVVDIGWGGIGISQAPLLLEKVEGGWLDFNTPKVSLPEFLTLVGQELQKSIAIKQIINEIYSEIIPCSFQLPREFQTWRFNLLLPEEKHQRALIDNLKDQGLFCSSHYRALKDAPEEFPVASYLAKRVINLFNDRYYSVEQARRTAELVSDFLKDKSPPSAEILKQDRPSRGAIGADQF